MEWCLRNADSLLLSTEETAVEKGPPFKNLEREDILHTLFAPKDKAGHINTAFQCLCSGAAESICNNTNSCKLCRSTPPLKREASYGNQNSMKHFYRISVKIKYKNDPPATFPCNVFSSSVYPDMLPKSDFFYGKEYEQLFVGAVHKKTGRWAAEQILLKPWSSAELW